MKLAPELLSKGTRSMFDKELLSEDTSSLFFPKGRAHKMLIVYNLVFLKGTRLSFCKELRT